ncbi:MAG: hypothetical protein KDB68_17680 [Planctomycetes bacterium]|nr:hypothetical protein [Planctomycetota bacterium]
MWLRTGGAGFAAGAVLRTGLKVALTQGAKAAAKYGAITAAAGYLAFFGAGGGAEGNTQGHGAPSGPPSIEQPVQAPETVVEDLEIVERGYRFSNDQVLNDLQFSTWVATTLEEAGEATITLRVSSGSPEYLVAHARDTIERANSRRVAQGRSRAVLVIYDQE